MTKARKITKNADLAPPDWAAIRIRYEAGILSVRALGREYGVTHRGITQRAAKEGWVRALAPAIAARADQILARQAHAEAVEAAGQAPKPEPGRSDQAIDKVVVDHAAQITAEVKRMHRGIIGRSRTLVEAMLAELAAAQNAPELFGRVCDMLADGGEDVPAALLRRVAELVESLPHRAKTLGLLVDSLKSLVGMEREAYGMAAQEGTGRPLVQVHDMTGAGDPDAPPREPDAEDD